MVFKLTDYLDKRKGMYGTSTPVIKEANQLLNQYKKAVAPAANTVVDAALYVIINVVHATKYEFKYESDGGFVDYGVIPIADNAGAGPVRIDIQPIAWKGCACATGDVTFIYNQSSASN